MSIRCLLGSHRIARYFIGKFGEKFVARHAGKYQRIFYSCEISRHAQFLGKVSLPHPLGIVIGIGTIIGDNSIIYQCVTIAGKNKATGAVTKIGNNVTIYPNVVIAKQVNIGNNVVIGAGSVVLQDIPDNVIVAGIPARPIKSSK